MALSPLFFVVSLLTLVPFPPIFSSGGLGFVVSSNFGLGLRPHHEPVFLPACCVEGARKVRAASSPAVCGFSSGSMGSDAASFSYFRASRARRLAAADARGNRDIMVLILSSVSVFLSEASPLF